jgi:TrmH family RNA methyltransferase
MNITSRDNSLLRRARAIRDGKIQDSIFVEGLRLCEEALASRLKIEAVVYSERFKAKERAARLIESLEKAGTSPASVSEKLLASISYTKTPQGIVLLAARPVFNLRKFQEAQPNNPLLVVMHGINNPVNVGAIVRTAEAAGAAGVIVTAGTSDPFSPKALRGAMGSAFRLPFWPGAKYEEVIAWCGERHIRTICADVSGSKLYTELDWLGARALIVGPESTGLTPDEMRMANEGVRVPMKGSAESLNVAVATGVLLFEANRQRGLKAED